MGNWLAGPVMGKTGTVVLRLGRQDDRHQRTRTDQGGSDVDGRRGDRRSEIAHRAQGLGTESFHDGLVALLDGALAAGSFNELGMAVLRDQAVGLLRIRLEVEDWYRRHPEIAEQEILPPLFGLGLPRTGSTALSFLLGEDPRARSLLAWECGAPTPPPDPATYDTDPRIAAAAVHISLIDEMAPKFKTMLPSSPTGPTECLQIMALDFRSAMFGALGDNRHYEAWLASCDMVSAYRYHERVPQATPVALPHEALATQVTSPHGFHRRPRRGLSRSPIRDDPPRYRASDPLGGEPPRCHV